jgi:glycosyltransferase involved in cell wall biosynthesis
MPLVVTAQGELTMDAAQIFQKSPYVRNLLRSVVQEANFVTGCSERTLNDLQSFVGVDLSARSRVVFNGVNIEDFPQTKTYVHTRPYVFAFGRLAEEKGFDILLRAFSKIAASNLDLLIAGSGPCERKLRDLATELGDDRVKFLGQVDHFGIVGFLKGCELVAIPSRAHEGLPVALVESMAAGKPIVATLSGGTPEAITDGESGLLIPMGDEAALTAAIGKLLKQPELGKRLGFEALKRSRQFSWDVIAEDYLQIYRRLLSAELSAVHQ